MAPEIRITPPEWNSDEVSGDQSSSKADTETNGTDTNVKYNIRIPRPPANKVKVANN